MLTQERKVAARLAMAAINAHVCQEAAPGWFGEGLPVVVALDTDTLNDVMQRVVKYPPPIVLAVHFASTDRLELLALAPR